MCHERLPRLSIRKSYNGVLYFSAVDKAHPDRRTLCDGPSIKIRCLKTSRVTFEKFVYQRNLHNKRTNLAVCKCSASTAILVASMTVKTKIHVFIRDQWLLKYTKRKNTYGAIMALAGPWVSSAAPNQFSNWLLSSLAAKNKNANRALTLTLSLPRTSK